jgi:hypothetical protein
MAVLQGWELPVLGWSLDLDSTVFLAGAILGNRARQPVLYIAQSWGGSEKHKPLMDKVLEWRKRTSPKLEPSTAPPLEYSLKNAA